jgi:hypothetical protein
MSRFRGVDGRSPPLPTAQCSSLFGIVSQWTDRKALPRLSSLSSSRLGFSHRVPGGVSPGCACRQVASSRVRQPLNEPHGPFTRIDRTERFWSEPRWGIGCRVAPNITRRSTMEHQQLTHFNKNGLVDVALATGCGACVSTEVCLRRPPPCAPRRSCGHWIEVGGLDRTRRDPFRGAPTGLLSEASIEPDKHLSAHPALPVRTVRTGEARPFLRLVTASWVVLPFVKGQRLLSVADDAGPSNSPLVVPYRTLRSEIYTSFRDRLVALSLPRHHVLTPLAEPNAKTTQDSVEFRNGSRRPVIRENGSCSSSSFTSCDFGWHPRVCVLTLQQPRRRVFLGAGDVVPQPPPNDMHEEPARVGAPYPSSVFRRGDELEELHLAPLRPATLTSFGEEHSQTLGSIEIERQHVFERCRLRRSDFLLCLTRPSGSAGGGFLVFV